MPAAAPPSPIVKSLALLASAFWLHYCLVHDVLGLLTIDEIYFAHIFWLMREGLEPYTDFYSVHLPAYFRLVGLLVPPGPPLDLSFVWTLRAISAAAIAAHAILLLTLCRRDFLYLFPLLLLFVTAGRMVEIRPDTIGLLLFNLGWWWLLRGSRRANMLLAAACAGAALFFSARAAVMIVGMAALLAFLCARRKDATTFAYLALLAAGLAAIVALAYAADPATFMLILKSVYLDPAQVNPDVSFASRILSVDRFLLLAMIVLALIGAVLAIRQGKGGDKGWVIGAACVTQLVLVAVDPSPYQYVYSWAALPTLVGISLLGRGSERGLHAGLAFAGGGLAISVLSLSVAHTISGRPPLAGAILRLTYDRPFASAELERAPTPRLLSMMVTAERQQSLWNQLALLREICGRIRDPVLARFYAHPICLPDARYDWAGLKWPAFLEGDKDLGTANEFADLFARRPPKLVAWGKHHYTPPPTAWGRSLLEDYEVYDGFAVRRDPGVRPPSGSPDRR